MTALCQASSLPADAMAGGSSRDKGDHTMKLGANQRLLPLIGLLGGAFLLLAQPVGAQQLVYRPTNPAFGGNPLNQQWLLSVAQAQKSYEERDLFVRDPLEDFQSGLQRQILSAISREIVVNRFGEDLDLTQAGRFDLGDFIIEIIPGLTGIDLVVINALTGDQTTVTIPIF
jgi:curli production assembly/transport component CsgF